MILFRKTQTKMFTLRERKNQFIVGIKNQSRKTISTTQTLIKYMKNILAPAMKVLTLDNDMAFANHEDIGKAMKAELYFCEPYKSYQKGAIENANKLIRTQLPKRTDITLYSQSMIDKIIKKLNERPMKCLNYKTPSEVFYKAFETDLNLIASCA